MRVKVDFYATLRQIVGQKRVEFDVPDDATVRQLVDEIIRLYPPLGDKLLNDNGALYGHVHVIVNGRDTPYLENAFDTVLKSEDRISVFPAVGGG